MMPTGTQYFTKNREELYKINNAFFTTARQASVDYFSTLEATFGMAIEKISGNPEKFNDIVEKLHLMLAEIAKVATPGELPIVTIRRIVANKMGLPEKDFEDIQKLGVACMVLSMMPDGDGIFKLMGTFVDSISSTIELMKDEQDFYKKQLEVLRKKYELSFEESNKKLNDVFNQVFGIDGMASQFLKLIKSPGFNKS